MRRLPPPIALACALGASLLLPSLVRADALDAELAAARKLLESGQVVAAEDQFGTLADKVKLLLADKPEDAHLNYIAGSVSMYLGEDAQAERALDAAVRLDPKNLEYLLARARLAAFEDKFADAVIHASQILELDPKSVEAWLLLGDAQMQLKQFAEAQKSFQAAADLQPAESGHFLRLARALRAQDKDDEAVAALHKAGGLAPKDAQSWAELGQIEQARAHYPAAADAYQQVAALTPDDWRNISRLMQVYQQLGKTAERDAARRRILALKAQGKMTDPAFCRDQFKHGDVTIVVFEYFELAGPTPARYAFAILKPDGKSVARRIALETDGPRAFQLDAYVGQGHETLARFDAEPTYEQARDQVLKYLDGKGKATTRAGGTP